MTATAKKEKKVRAKGTPQPAIKWFQEQAAKTQNIETIKEAAVEQKYSASTITIQIGRLRANGQLPKVETVKKVKKTTEAKVRKFRPVPKPGHKGAAA